MAQSEVVKVKNEKKFIDQLIAEGKMEMTWKHKAKLLLKKSLVVFTALRYVAKGIYTVPIIGAAGVAVFTVLQRYFKKKAMNWCWDKARKRVADALDMPRTATGKEIYDEVKHRLKTNVNKIMIKGYQALAVGSQALVPHPNGKLFLVSNKEKPTLPKLVFEKISSFLTLDDAMKIYLETGDKRFEMKVGKGERVDAIYLDTGKVNPKVETHEKTIEIVYEIMGFTRDILPSGITWDIIDNPLLQLDLSAAELDIIKEADISKRNSQKRKERFNNLQKAKINLENAQNKVDRIKFSKEIERIKVEQKLKLPWTFSIEESVDLSKPEVIEYIKKCKEDYLRIPARFRGLDSPVVRFYNEITDHERINKADIGAYIPSSNEIVIATNPNYLKLPNYGIRGSTISVIAHEMGLFVESIMDSKTKIFWKTEIYLKTWEDVLKTGNTRAAERSDELLADLFMEYTTGGLRIDHIKQNILNGINNSRIDIIENLNKLIENNDLINPLIYHLYSNGIFKNLELIVENSKGFQQRLDFNELMEMKYDENLIIRIIENNLNNKREDIINSINEYLENARKKYSKVEIYDMVRSIMESIENYGNLEDNYLIKGLGLLDRFPQMLEFMKKHYGYNNYLKGDLLEYYDIFRFII